MIDQSLAKQMITQCCSARHRKFVLGNLHGSRKDRVERGTGATGHHWSDTVLDQRSSCTGTPVAREQVKAA